jgi:hypothetical protein
MAILIDELKFIPQYCNRLRKSDLIAPLIAIDLMLALGPAKDLPMLLSRQINE